MSELFGNPEQVSELSGNPEQLPYTPTTEEVRESYVLMQKCSAYPEPEAEFDRWLAEVKAQERERIIQLLKEEQSVHYALGNHYGEIAISAAIHYIEKETK